ncbi:MAG: peptide deformylase [Patescibacteria group bacterium]
MEQILSKDNPRLRQIATSVTSADFNDAKFKEKLVAMRETLESFADGIALAGPQIGLNKRVFIISEKINLDREDKIKNLIFINPEIKRQSKRRMAMEEGCLSVRNIYGETKRHEKVTVEAQDENGKKFQYHGSDLFAQIFQHEIDHLNGILFIDHAKELHEVTPNKS